MMEAKIEIKSIEKKNFLIGLERTFGKRVKVLEIIEKYVASHVCSNCKNLIRLYIPIGMIRDKYLEKNKMCPKCKCPMTRKRKK